MRKDEVGCAIISAPSRSAVFKKYGGRILIAQRSPGGHLGGYWEFPGGKRKAREDMRHCLVREVGEELGVGIEPRRLLCRRDYRYPEKIVQLHFYLCDWIIGDPAARECYRWACVYPEELRGYRFPPADEELVLELIRRRFLYFGGVESS